MIVWAVWPGAPGKSGQGLKTCCQTPSATDPLDSVHLMSRYQALSFDVVKSLFNGPGVYQLAFSFEYGMSESDAFVGRGAPLIVACFLAMFHTFIGGQ